MYGIILDDDWDAGQDPITVVVIGSRQEMEDRDFVDCSQREDAWDRAHVERLVAKTVTCTDGNERDAHICRYP